MSTSARGGLNRRVPGDAVDAPLPLVLCWGAGDPVEDRSADLPSTDSSLSSPLTGPFGWTVSFLMLGRGTKACGDRAVSLKPLYLSDPPGDPRRLDRTGGDRAFKGVVAREGDCEDSKGEAKPRSLFNWPLFGVTRKEEEARGGKAGFLVDAERSRRCPVVF